MITPVVVETWAAPPAPPELLRRLRHRPQRFLLESQGGPADLARCSFLGQSPFMLFQSHGRRLTLREANSVRQWEGDPLEAVETLLARYPVAPHPDWPPFVGGAVGYFGYDLGRQIERLPTTAVDDLHLPDIWLAFYDHLLAIDHVAQCGSIIALPLPRREAQSIANARELARLLRIEGPERMRSEAGPPSQAVELTSNLTRAQYLAVVRQALAHIGAGHIYQVNLAQRFTTPMPCAPEELYQRLRAHNPAPFAAFIEGGDFHLVSASPERFLHFDPRTRRIETRPIKGTRQRGATPEADAQFRAELLASEKDTAELVMIVDLERNDLGKVCDYGSVHVPDLRRIEAYPTVWHTVATVAGQVSANVRQADLLRATFPGGSITGAPKIRAMQIIEELEGLRRQVYCGAIGYLGFDGALDLNIAIRTLTVKNNRAYFHAGGGIVADSEPEAEYDESLHKARALAAALGFVI